MTEDHKVPGSIPGFGTPALLLRIVLKARSKLALAGNRTPVSRVAGENSTTEPPMLDWSATFLENKIKMQLFFVLFFHLFSVALTRQW